MFYDYHDLIYRTFYININDIIICIILYQFDKKHSALLYFFYLNCHLCFYRASSFDLETRQVSVIIISWESALHISYIHSAADVHPTNASISTPVLSVVDAIQFTSRYCWNVEQRGRIRLERCDYQVWKIMRLKRKIYLIDKLYFDITTFQRDRVTQRNEIWRFFCGHDKENSQNQ